MCVLIGNIVKTEFADYPCATREEAEALFMRLREREQQVAGRGHEKPSRRREQESEPTH